MHIILCTSACGGILLGVWMMARVDQDKSVELPYKTLVLIYFRRWQEIKGRKSTELAVTVLCVSDITGYAY